MALFLDKLRFYGTHTQARRLGWGDWENSHPKACFPTLFGQKSPKIHLKKNRNFPHPRAVPAHSHTRTIKMDGYHQ